MRFPKRGHSRLMSVVPSPTDSVTSVPARSREETREAHPVPERSSANPSRLVGRSADQALVFNRGLCERAFQTAVDSGLREVDPQQLEALVAEARAEAVAQVPEGFNPRDNPYDAQRQRQFDEARAKRAQEEQGLAWAEQRQAEEEEKLAELMPPGPKPRTPWLGLACVILLFAISLAPTLQALFSVGVIAGPQQWIVPFVLACLVGLGLAVPQMRACQAVNSAWWERHTFLLGGMVSAACLAAFRFGLATSAEGNAIGWALVGLDVAAVIIAEGIAAHHRREWLTWHERHEPYVRQQSIVQAAATEVGRRRAAVGVLEQFEKDFLQEVLARESLHRAGPSLIEESVRTTEEGYHAGIAFNRAQAVRGSAFVARRRRASDSRTEE